MRLRHLALPLLATSVLLVACTSTPTPPPSVTTEEMPVVAPTTLPELETVIQDAGIVDIASVSLVSGHSHQVAVQLLWEELPSPDDQLAVLAEVGTGVDEILDGAEITQIFLGPMHTNGRLGGVQATYNPGTEVLHALLSTTYDTACSAAELYQRDVGEGPSAQVDLRCYIDADDVVGLASSYDAVTATRFDIDGIDDTRWEVSVEGWASSDALFRFDVGPVEGRQALLVDLATMAEDAGADRIQIVDSALGFTFHGFADADQSELCTAMHDRITAAGVEHSSVYMQLPEPDGDEAWACSLLG